MMKYLCLNPRLLPSKEAMLAYVSEELAFAPGGALNLDALYDQLTSYFEPASILCLDFKIGGDSLYPYAGGVYRVLSDAAQANRALRVDVITLPAA